MKAVAATDNPYLGERYLLREHFDVFRAIYPDLDVGSGTALHSQNLFTATAEEGHRTDIPVLVRVYRPKIKEAVAVSLPSDSTGEYSVSLFDLVARDDRDALVMGRVLDSLLRAAEEERFEDGMDSNLGVGIRVLFRNYGEAFAAILDERLSKQDLQPHIVAEILHTLGSIENDATKDRRFATLLTFLKSPSINVRDAAAIGLAYLNDKRAIQYLREAIDREPEEVFKQDLRAVVEQIGA